MIPNITRHLFATSFPLQLKTFLANLHVYRPIAWESVNFEINSKDVLSP